LRKNKLKDETAKIEDKQKLSDDTFGSKVKIFKEEVEIQQKKSVTKLENKLNKITMKLEKL
jgi:hypothetical protein